MASDDVFKEWDELKKREKQNITPTKKLLFQFLKNKGKTEEEIMKKFMNYFEHHKNPTNLGNVMSRDDAETIIKEVLGVERAAEARLEKTARDVEEEIREEFTKAEQGLRREAAAERRMEDESLKDLNEARKESVKERQHQLKERESEEKRRRKAAAKKNRASKWDVAKARAGFLDPGNYGAGSPVLKRLVFLAAVIHIFDGWVLKFSSGLLGPNVLWTLVRILVYGAIAFFAASKMSGNNKVYGFVALEVMVPFFIGFLASLDLGFLSLGMLSESFLIIFWTFTPALALYMSYKDNGLLSRIWLVLLVGCLVLSFFASGFVSTALNSQGGRLPVSQSLVSTQLDVDQAFDTVMGYFGEAFNTVKDRVGKAWSRSINYATGGYYTSLVEDQEGEPVGLYIENMRFTQDYYFEGDPVYLWADIRGQSFKEDIEVYTGCKTRDGVLGTTEPSYFEIFYRGGESVQCMFENLSEGSKSVIIEAGFNFETTAYVTYTFVDEQTVRNYFAQDKDINRELDIDQRLTPRHTPGPVSIGMSSDLPQPVSVREDSNGAVVNTVFGVTLENIWTDGELDRVNEFTVLIPNEFSLTKCDADYEYSETDPFCSQDPERCARGMNAYTFQNIGTPKTFKTVNCRLVAKEGMTVEDIIPVGQQKAQKSFIVTANYDYLLRESKRTEVREIAR